MSSMVDGKARAARSALRDERARDAKLAMEQYEANKLAVLTKTERLRALRLANEAGTAPKKKTKRPAKAER